MANHSVIVRRAFLLAVVFLKLTATMYSQTPLRIGVIGLDTSHAPAFAKLFNSDNATGLLANQIVTHAFPGGSHDIEQSHSRVPGYTNELSNMGIKIVDSIDSMLPEIDAVLLLSVDGRKHLEQVAPVFKAGKPVFIDKPLGGTLAECIAIKKLGDHYNAAWFTSSSLRFSPEMIRYREDLSRQGTVIGATSWGPCSLEATHPDLYWYGVHGVEVLYTAMGKGCETVTRIATPDTDVAVGVWNDGRIGDFRGLRAGASGYGLVVFGKQAIEVGGKYEGYGPLVNQIAQFFHDRTGGVDHGESIEMFTFMEAADESKRLGGTPVKLSDVYSKAELQANELIKPWLK
ncbi:Gfo/Idh/MocA family protein [Pirellulaceae bacterium SH449]